MNLIYRYLLFGCVVFLLLAEVEQIFSSAPAHNFPKDIDDSGDMWSDARHDAKTLGDQFISKPP